MIATNVQNFPWSQAWRCHLHSSVASLTTAERQTRLHSDTAAVGLSKV